LRRQRTMRKKIPPKRKEEKIEETKDNATENSTKEKGGEN